MHAGRLGWLVLAGVALATAAQAQTAVRVRGTIAALDGNVLAVRARDGRDLRLQLVDGATVAVARAVRFEDLKPGDYVGATTRPGPDGRPTALEVHFLAPTAPEGQGAWDLEPGTTMTNANVTATVVASGNRELTVSLKGVAQTFAVPADAPIVRTVPGTRADLAPGEYVFVAAQAGADGALTAARIQVSKDGVRPPQ